MRYIKKASTGRRLALLLINTRDHSLDRREIRMRLRYRPDFEQVYAEMLAAGIIAESGTGREGDPYRVTLLDSARALVETE